MLNGRGDHGRPMMSWKRQMLDPFSKRARRIFQVCSTSCSASILMVTVLQSTHAGALWPRWVDYFMAGKISKGSSHQDHQGPCEKRLRELEKGHVEGHLTAAHCYLQGGCQ